MDQEKALLRLLFPALSASGPDRVARDIGRICYESSLSRVLNYGAVSGNLLADEAVKLVRMPKAMIKNLRESAEQQNLRHAHLQLRTVYDDGIVGSDSQSFWRAIAKQFDSEPSYAEIKSWHQFTDLSHIWVRGIATGYIREHLPSASDVQMWINEGCIHLPSCFLYFASAALGANSLPRRSEYNKLLSEGETQGLTKELAVRLSNELQNESAPAIKKPVSILGN